MSVNAVNPILPGFYPDPSACAVGDDYYIVNSSFVYFPGLPIMHSKDLAHWEQIGNVMTRNSQLPLGEDGHSRGLFAPTIRYNNGTFYVICTNVSFGGNYIVTATDPKGPWSEPHYIEGADGIDPSLFFDEDGKCYFIGTHPNPDGCRWDGDWFIYIQELDIENFKLVGEAKNVWNGAMRGVHWPEGPHLYKIGEYYYILHAEGGTGPEHAISVARSKEVFGPYEQNFCNPIFTHRHLGQKYPIKYVGHGDLFQIANGDWYIIMLAVRPANGYTTMGRETFMARVIFENGWPVINPGLGVLSSELVIDLPEWKPDEDATLVSCDRLYQFKNMDHLGPEFMTLRNPVDDFYKFEDECLKLKCRPVALTEQKNPSFVCVRQDSHVFEASCVLKPDGLFEGAKAGMVYMQSNTHHLKFEFEGMRGNVILCKEGVEERLASVLVAENTITLLLRVLGTKASLYIGTGNKVSPVITEVDISALSTEVAGGFVGNTIGIYATDVEDREEPVWASFRSFAYRRVTPKDIYKMAEDMKAKETTEE